MRCFPRKARHQWVFFLILLCLLGVYLAYKRLLESEEKTNRNFGIPVQDGEKIPKDVQKMVQADLKLPKIPVEHKKLPVEHKKLPVEHKKLIKPDVAKKDLPPIFPAGRVLENEDDYVTYDEKITRLKLLLLTLSPSNWKNTLDPDEMILLVKSEFMDLGIESKISCKEVDHLKTGSGRYQGHYGKKIIEYIRQDFTTDLVFKSVGRDAELKVQCMRLDYNEERCHLMTNYRLVRELVMFNILDDPAIIKLEGYCLRGETIDPRVSKKGVILVTEAGKPLQPDTLPMMAWSSKVEIFIHLLKLLLHFDSSPVGPLRFEQLHLQDFVLIKTDLKLVDLDNLAVGEVHCLRDQDCRLQFSPYKEFKCVDKICKGMNLWNNLFRMNEVLFSQLLKYVPQNVNNEVKSLQDNMLQMKLTLKEVLRWFQKHSQTGEVIESEETGQKDIPPIVYVKTPAPDTKSKTKKPDSDDLPPAQPGFDNIGDHSYDRINNANFPEMMTAVMKSAGDNDIPDTNHGATLFRKNRRKTHKASNDVVESAPKDDQEDKIESANAEVNAKLCLSKVSSSLKSARSRREKRLFTHLGLKGINEDEWRYYAQSLSIVKYVGLSSLAPSYVEGGKFKFEFDKNVIDLKRGEFIAEVGPVHYHSAYFISYHLDRVLGLYHIPPTIARTLSETELNSLHGEKFPMAKLKNISSSDGLHGIVTVSMPPVMKTDKLLIEKRKKLVTSVQEFSRNQKVQIEYILLWTLAKMTQPPHGFLGYKGHLIHFESDLAFQSLHKILNGYFYNCQFPNTVYKTLVCYKCQDARKMTSVCGLGFEVIRRVKNSGMTDAEIRIGSLSSKDIMNLIDNSASAVFQVVEQCIKTFSREKVLY